MVPNNRPQRHAREAMWHKRITLTLAVLAVLLLLISGPGTRADLWPFRVGFGMFAGALLALPLQRPHSGPLLVAALMLGAASAAVPLDYVRRVKTLPYINDITTDTDRPPQFSPPKKYESHFAEFQRRRYPNVRPLGLPLAERIQGCPDHPPEDTAGKSLRSMKAWEESKPS